MLALLTENKSGGKKGKRKQLLYWLINRIGYLQSF